MDVSASDIMTLSVVVGIPDFVYTYMELMKTATSNVHAFGLTYSPQDEPFVYSQTLIFREAHLSSAPTRHGMEYGVMPWPYPLL